MTKATVGTEAEHFHEFGRIRLNEREARFLYWLMAEERLRLLDERRYAKAADLPVTSYQQMTSRIRRLRTRIEELAAECAWDLGEPLFTVRRHDP